MNQDPFFFSDSDDGNAPGSGKGPERQNGWEARNGHGSVASDERLRAADYRMSARKLLWGRFFWAAFLVYLLAVLLRAFDFGVSLDIDIDSAALADLIRNSAGDLNAYASGLLELVRASLQAHQLFTILSAVAGIAAAVFLGSAVRVGFSRFELHMLDCNEPEIRVGTLFSAFRNGNYVRCVRLGLAYMGIMLLTQIPQLAGSVAFFVLLLGEPDVWTLLLAASVSITGVLVSLLLRVIAELAYSFAFFIAAEEPEVGAIEALRRSRQMMKGNKWRLFCVQISYLGWMILAALVTCGIGELFILPFVEAANTIFYSDISNRPTRKKADHVDPDYGDFGNF